MRIEAFAPLVREVLFDGRTMLRSIASILITVAVVACATDALADPLSLVDPRVEARRVATTNLLPSGGTGLLASLMSTVRAAVGVHEDVHPASEPSWRVPEPFERVLPGVAAAPIVNRTF